MCLKSTGEGGGGEGGEGGELEFCVELNFRVSVQECFGKSSGIYAFSNINPRARVQTFFFISNCNIKLTMKKTHNSDD